jgi:hypothetical protein
VPAAPRWPPPLRPLYALPRESSLIVARVRSRSVTAWHIVISCHAIEYAINSQFRIWPLAPGAGPPRARAPRGRARAGRNSKLPCSLFCGIARRLRVTRACRRSRDSDGILTRSVSSGRDQSQGSSRLSVPRCPVTVRSGRAPPRPRCPRPSPGSACAAGRTAIWSAPTVATVAGTAAPYTNWISHTVPRVVLRSGLAPAISLRMDRSADF